MKRRKRSDSDQQQLMWFDGVTYDEELDQPRLAKQLTSVLGLMIAGKWRTLGEISRILCAPEASVSARLRDLRKRRFGKYIVRRRRRGEGKKGLWEYRVEVPPMPAAEVSS
jgi:hypothetical protein